MPDKPEKLNPESYVFERREFIRISGNFVVSYSDVTTREAKSDITQTKNISAGGIFLTTDRKFPVGTVLRVKLRLPDTPDYIDIKVKVMGSHQRVKGVLYDTRVKFIRIRDEDRVFIRKMVDYSLRKGKEGQKGDQSEK
ncbi:MAG: PilZ domain-containing protein [Candidatus Omnitrophica bacterium]|nr:PilZ domain-containing protein [Candidatus Omnitrophota bacterium]